MSIYYGNAFQIPGGISRNLMVTTNALPAAPGKGRLIDRQRTKT